MWATERSSSCRQGLMPGGGQCPPAWARRCDPVYAARAKKPAFAGGHARPRLAGYGDRSASLRARTTRPRWMTRSMSTIIAVPFISLSALRSGSGLSS